MTITQDDQRIIDKSVQEFISKVQQIWTDPRIFNQAILESSFITEKRIKHIWACELMDLSPEKYTTKEPSQWYEDLLKKYHNDANLQQVILANYAKYFDENGDKDITTNIFETRYGTHLISIIVRLLVLEAQQTSQNTVTDYIMSSRGNAARDAVDQKNTLMQKELDRQFANVAYITPDVINFLQENHLLPKDNNIEILLNHIQTKSPPEQLFFLQTLQYYITKQEKTKQENTTQENTTQENTTQENTTQEKTTPDLRSLPPTELDDFLLARLPKNKTSDKLSNLEKKINMHTATLTKSVQEFSEKYCKNLQKPLQYQQQWSDLIETRETITDAQKKQILWRHLIQHDPDIPQQLLAELNKHPVRAFFNNATTSLNCFRQTNTVDLAGLKKYFGPAFIRAKAAESNTSAIIQQPDDSNQQKNNRMS